MHGSKISSIRLARGYTQDYVAKRVGIDQRTYSKIEKDEKMKVDDELLDKIAGTLGVSAEDIKSPTPIIMTFHNNPHSGQHAIHNDNIVIETFMQQLRQKDEQIAKLMAMLDKQGG